MEQQHTQEPWRANDAQADIDGPNGEPVAVCYCNDDKGDDAIANARRIVACVNACAGISTENLETNLPVNELARRYNVVLGQRELLLMALRQFKQADNEAQLIEAMDRANEIMVGITTVEGGAQ